jgi:hypothetical protein
MAARFPADSARLENWTQPRHVHPATSVHGRPPKLIWKGRLDIDRRKCFGGYPKKISSGKLVPLPRLKETMTVPDTDIQINFAAPAVLRKWPSIRNERVSASLGANPYLVAEGTLDECIRQFMAKPIHSTTCTKFTPRLNSTWSARSSRQSTSSNWLGCGISSDHQGPRIGSPPKYNQLRGLPGA